MSDNNIEARVRKIVVEHLGVDEDKVTKEASFIDDLGADSLDTVELVMAFEEEFGVETTWSRLLAGRNGAVRVSGFEVSDLPCQIACCIPRGDGSDGTFNPDL